jgi:hypothetical protein
MMTLIEREHIKYVFINSACFGRGAVLRQMKKEKLKLAHFDDFRFDIEYGMTSYGNATDT